MIYTTIASVKIKSLLLIVQWMHVFGNGMISLV